MYNERYGEFSKLNYPEKQTLKSRFLEEYISLIKVLDLHGMLLLVNKTKFILTYFRVTLKAENNK